MLDKSCVSGALHQSHEHREDTQMNRLFPVITEVFRVCWDVLAAVLETLILGKKPEAQEDL